MGKKNMEIDEYGYGAGGDVEEVDDGVDLVENNPEEFHTRLERNSLTVRVDVWGILLCLHLALHAWYS